ncbi:MAG: polyketide cyclase [Yaniella sp.]|uniref:polyketide cyclase n=1 Tax=Yaniella sp. TaxID=2773929 RepID=UPI003F990A22
MSKHSAATISPDAPDEITRSIHINATANTVWDIIREPGWFINDGTWSDHEITTEGNISLVIDPVHGDFQIETVELNPPHRAIFRWLGGMPGTLENKAANTIEFTIETAATGVVLTVHESGFASLSDDASVRRQRLEENTQGWATELELARQRAEGSA